MLIRFVKIAFEFTIPIFIVVQAKRAEAFDPVAAVYVAKAASTYMASNYSSSQGNSDYQGAVDRAEEAADIGISLADLLSDLGEADGGEEQLRSAVERMNKTKRTIEDIHWNGSELDRAVNGDLQRGETLGRRIRAFGRAVQAGKAIAAIAGYRPKAAEKVIKIQDMRLNTMAVEELQGIRRDLYLANLQSQQAQVNRQIYLKELQGERR